MKVGIVASIRGGNLSLTSVEAIAGYLLEEVLAVLLRSNGYKLLQSVADDEHALSKGGHGLLVRGRGAAHQADALGELRMPSPFSLPVRLFVEAKNRATKVSLADVRNAHGIISDVNEQYSSDYSRSLGRPLRRYQYRYALFSTGGFKTDAQSYALAQHISLVDLSGPAFEVMTKTIRDAAQIVRQLADDQGLESFPVRQARLALRTALAAAETTGQLRGSAVDGQLRETAEQLASEEKSGGLASAELAVWAAETAVQLTASATGEGIVLGFPSAPFILAMRPDNLQQFVDYVGVHGPDVPVSIGFGGEAGVAGDWVVTPRAHPEGFRLNFGLPGALEKWLLAVPGEAHQRAAQAKDEFLSEISLFLEDRLVRLQFERTPVANRSQDQVDLGAEADSISEAEDAGDMSYLRAERKSPPRPRPSESDVAPVDLRRARPAAPPGVMSGGGWTPEAVEELMERLDRGGYVQGDLIRAAARQGGVVSREEVYKVANFARDRSLRGITRPSSRIAAQLVEWGRLPVGATYPFQAYFGNGVRATHFVVPENVAAALRKLELGSAP